MKLLHLRSKSKFLITDSYFLRFELLDDYKPENNEDVKRILDEVSATQEQSNEPALKETLPFASFKAAEEFFNQLRLVAAKETKQIKFAYFAIWKYDQAKKVKVGKKNSGKGNPHEYISFNKPGYEFSITSEYQNMTPQLFEIIFNDPDNIDKSYESKISYCKIIQQAYSDSTHAADDEIAKLPSLDEVEKGPVSLEIPALTTSVSDNSTGNTDQNVVYDATTGKFIDPTVAKTTEQDTKNKKADFTINKKKAPVTINAQGTRTFDRPVQSEKKKENKKAIKKNNSQAPARRLVRKNIEDEVKEQVDLAREKGYVDAPQFAIEELDPVEPGHSGYVEYCVNQKKKTFNKQLQKIAKEISNKNEKAIIGSRNNYSKSIDNEVKKFKKQHANDPDQIFNQIQRDIKDKKDTEYQKQIEIVDASLQDLLEKAKIEYQQKTSELKHKAGIDKKKIEERLTQKYTALAEQIFDKNLAKHDDNLQKAENDLVHKLTLKFELLSREEAAQLRADGDKVLQNAFGEMNKQLTSLRIKANKDNNTAKEINISQQRVENEKLRLETPSEDLKDAQDKIQDMQDKLSTAEAGLKHYKDIANKQEATLHANRAEIKQLNDEINTLNTKQATEKVNKTNNKSADMLNNLIALQVAQQMGKQPSVLDNSQHVSTPQDQVSSSDNNQMKLAMKGFKRLAFGFGTIIIILVAGGGYAFVHQQNEYNQQLAESTRTMNAKIAAANQQRPLSQNEANKKALVALHENSDKKLDKYNNEKYYNLDKAIIANDANAANNAVKALGNDLNLQDHYRAVQTQNLLQKAGNSELANKVSDANK